MARCKSCGSALLADAILCPTCDHPVKNKDKLLIAYAIADAKAALSEEPSIENSGSQIPMVCPHCKEVRDVSIPHDGWLDVRCKACGKNFRTLLAIIRAKRSRGDRRSDARSNSVRVRYGPGTEELIEYIQSGYHDFELRAGDLVLFSYVNDDVIVVQNLTIGQHHVVSTTWSELLSGVIGFALIILVIYVVFF